MGPALLRSGTARSGVSEPRVVALVGTAMTFPSIDVEIPWLSTEQMIEVDRAMIEDYGITLTQMMENAGRALALVAKARFLADSPKGRRVVVLAGTGGNGGGALVAARRLANWGADVHVLLAAAGRMTPVPAHQLNILHRMGIRVDDVDGMPAVGPVDLILDGIIGYSLQGAPRGAAQTMIEWANGHEAPVLALDAPSGVDASTGQAFAPSIRAEATLTLALPKLGLRNLAVARHVGELYLADISVPPGLYASPSLSLQVPAIFGANDVLRLL